MMLRTVYVTVGTTKFDSLINEITSKGALFALQQRGCQRLILQIGQGKPVSNIDEIRKVYGIIIEQYDFKTETPRSDIIIADLVIGHAGAGTCMDILKHNRSGLIVINEQLMDNHQTELALQLCNDGYLYCCKVSHLTESLNTIVIGNLSKYDKGSNLLKFVSYMNKIMTL